MKSLILIASIFVAQSAFAAPFKDLPGSIALKYERQAAADLVYQGRVLLPDEARALYESGKISDLSKLDPDSTSVIWNSKISKASVNDLAEMELKDSGETLEYVSDTPVPTGRLGFIAQKKNASGQVRAYQFQLDVKGHNALLRKSLLRKLGYVIPNTDRIKSVQIHFKSTHEKREFVKSITSMTFLENERWVTSNPDSDDEYLTLQDLIVFDGAEDTMYNLARGSMSSSTIQGRRVFNSLLVPYSMTDAPESINLMNWTGGQIFNSQLYMPYSEAEEFSTSYEDARWITRKILALTRNDWTEIVASAKIPQDASRVLVEKLISRRNFLAEKLGFSQEYPALNVNEQVPKLSGVTTPGYARHFSGIDPDSPLSKQEMVGLFKSKALSNVIGSLVTDFNNYMPATDLAFAKFDRALDLSAWQFAEFIKTKEVKSIPRNIWTKKFYDTNLIARRDIVAGNYLGTENIVQVADSIDMAVDLGVFYMGEGLPTQVSVEGRAKLSMIKSYTHIKPLSSIAMGLKEPFRNIMVPYLKRQSTMPLDNIVSLKPNHELTEDQAAELTTKIKAQMTDFDKLFGAGESLIVSTSVGPDLSLLIAKGLNKNAGLYLQLRDRLVGLKRLQIFRKDAKTVQVYMDPSVYNVFSLALGLRARIPIIEIGWDWKKGMISTYYFQFDINPKLDENPDFFKNITAVAAAMKGASLEYFKDQQKPWEIKHDFSDKDHRFNFLHWRYLNDNVRDVVRVTHPEGQTADFVRRTKGHRSGVDYQTLLLDVTNALINEKYPDTHLTSNDSGNPADTIKGKSVSRQVVVEAQLTPKGIRMDNLFAGVRYNWKGWDIKKIKAEKILDKIKNMFQQDIFPHENLIDTEKLQFYNIEVQLSLYQQAIEHILGLSKKEIQDIFLSESKNLARIRDGRSPFANAVTSDLAALKKYQQTGERTQIVDKLTEIVDVAESQLTFTGFKKFIGGEQNLFVRGTIRGFRVGSENGNQDLQSLSIGQIGSNDPQGPLSTIQRSMNITGGEFFISWLLNPF